MPGFVQAALSYRVTIADVNNPAELLNALEHVSRHQDIHVLGVWRLPQRYSNWKAWILNETVFVQRDVSPQFVENYLNLVEKKGGSTSGTFARIRSEPFTISEVMRSAGERWVFDLLLKFGMRDGFYVPLRHWSVVFWSDKRLTLAPPVRSLLTMVAAETVFRMERLVTRRPRDRAVNLTPRERSILRLMSMGKSTQECAQELGISIDTVWTHIKKATKKLDARTRIHAVAEALRRQLLD